MIKLSQEEKTREEQTRKSESRESLKRYRMQLRKNKAGITLVALVVTVVILLILAGVTVTYVLGDHGIFKLAGEAKNKTENAMEKEKEGIENLGNWSRKNPKVKLADGSEVELTKANVKDYLGKIVTNYKKTTGGATTETITAGTSETGTKECTVSKIYRLYYVDFDNKYGDGEGTIYLKADTTSNLIVLPITDITPNTASTVKLRGLNPSLYNAKAKNGTAIAPPASSQDNMKAVTWLTNTVNWEALKTSGNNTEISSDINYIVGSPSLEMMMDSYNTKYQLTGESPEVKTIAKGERVKLFYQYPYSGDENKYGYGVGPSAEENLEYYYWTSLNSLQSDAAIDTMYFPEYGKYYWLSSPSAHTVNSLMFVDVNNASRLGLIASYYYYDLLSICPIVSLKFNAHLELGV